MSRLTSGGQIDRASALSFTFDGRAYSGFSGDTLASALLANDVKLVGRSFKYHRPRGILTAGSEEPNALVELRTGARREPNTRATTAELFDGLVAASQNRWPSLAFDMMAVNGLLSPFFGAAFYYKTFMWPRSAWEKLYEPAIRRAAGLGRASGQADPDHYDKCNAFADVLVIGSGPAGLMAALTAARSGARVILAEEDFVFGGRLNAERTTIDDQAPAAFAASVIAELAGMTNVRLMRRTAVFGCYDSNTYGAIEAVSDHCPVPPAFQPRQRLWRIVARRAVLAAGALDRPIVFGGNDRPGVMLATAVQTYVNRFAVAPAKTMAVFTNNDAAWQSAFDVVDAGATVAVIIDVRPDVAAGLLAGARSRRIRTVPGGAVVAASGKTLRSVKVLANGTSEVLAVDGLAMSSGFSPNVQLTCHHQGRPEWNEIIAGFVPGKPPPGMTVAGSAAGTYALSGCLADGDREGAAAARDLGFSASPAMLPKAADQATGVKVFWWVKESEGLAFVDFQNDVKAKDVALAHKEGFSSVEHLKRYTTLGMATDQGKLANVPGLAILAEVSGRSIAETGTTVFRPPWIPVALGAVAGHHRGVDFRPTRTTPTHAFAEELGAVFVETGPWLRASYFLRPGEKDWQEAVNREVRAVRAGVGFIDVSTFGKIDLQGPDVGTFLDRIYINTYSTLAVGKVRYGIMLREDGIVMDDGTTARLAPDRWIMSTTTANAARVYQHLEFCHQVLWPELDVRMASVTEQWAQIAIAGPRARDVLAKVVDDPATVTNDALPHTGVVETRALGGVKARIFRLSFSGELAFEIAMPACRGEQLARAIHAAGAEWNITPYGIEALAVMRIEKGHVSGPELNGHTAAADLGFERMASRKKDYIGRVLAERPAFKDPQRVRLVGLRPADRAQRLKAGSHLLRAGAPPTMDNDLGYVTSVTHSPSLGHSIGLAMLANGAAMIGQTLRAWNGLAGTDIEVEVCRPCFYDPEGVRLRG